jgi:hypothetical protein
VVGLSNDRFNKCLPLRDLRSGHRSQHNPKYEKLNKIRPAVFAGCIVSIVCQPESGAGRSGAAGLNMALPIGLVIVNATIVSSPTFKPCIYISPGMILYCCSGKPGTLLGLVAASALLIDYILNVAVSVTAGVAAIASAFPALWTHKVIIALFLLVLITFANLRGLRESGTVMSIPVYFFIGTYLLMILVGLVRLAIEGPSEFVYAPAALEPLTVILVLHAFSTGCTALTGIESISNGVQAFQPPEAKNAGKTLIAMAILMGVLFVGSLTLTQFSGRHCWCTRNHPLSVGTPHPWERPRLLCHSGKHAAHPGSGSQHEFCWFSPRYRHPG